jgi:hypothetical protein
MSLCRFPGHLVALTLLLMVTPSQGASVKLIASLGGEAPGGGVFAGSGFVGNPATAGDGWVVFRSLISGGSNDERILLAKMTTGSTERKAIAGIGDDAPAGLGKFTGFVGNPGVNANGDVVFVATLTDATLLPSGTGLPAPAALFLYDKATDSLRAPVLARADTDAGLVAFVESFDASGDVDLDERSPVVNDAGDIAFTAATRGGATAEGAAVFLLPAGGVLQVLTKAGDAVGGSVFTAFGPPALNATGGVAFRGRLEGNGPRDGVFRWKNAVLTPIARDGDVVTTAEPDPHDQRITEFRDAVAINEDDGVAFLATPLFDYSFLEPDQMPDPGDAAFGILYGTGGPVEAVLYPGQKFESRGRVTDIQLQSEFASAPPGASFAANGDVIGYAVLNGGSSEVLARVAGPGQPPATVLTFGGTNPSPSPTGGTYLAATATPSIDDVDGIVVVARLAGGPVSDALVYDPESGPSTSFVAGQAAPGGGILAGPPFVNPALSKQGDVVFRAFVANGPAGLGLYRWRNGETTPLLRVGDPAPAPGSPPFTNIVGEHDLSDDGTVVFSAVAADFGRGVYTTGTSGTTRIAVVGDPGPAGLGENVMFVSVIGNPAISADGTVAFRARVQFTDSQGATRRREGIFVRSGTQVRTLALSGGTSPETLPFFRFRDLSLRQGVRVAFTASLGLDNDEQEGLFLGDLTSLATVAIAGEALDGKLSTFSGRPLINDHGVVTVLGRVQTDEGEHAAIMRGDNTFFESVVEIGDHGPAGGVFRSLGRPAVSPGGDMVFRATFEPGSGGVGGFFLEQGTELVPFVNTGDAAPTSIGGRFSSFNQRAAINDGDALAFISTLSGSLVENGLFLASLSSLRVGKTKIRLGTSVKADTMTLRAELVPGGLSVALDPSNARLDLTVRDAGSAVWRRVVAAGDLVKKKNKFVFRAPPDVNLIAVKVNKRTQHVKLKVRAQPDFSGGGVFPFEPPARVRFELGDVSGQATVGCVVKGRTVKCK